MNVSRNSVPTTSIPNPIQTPTGIGVSATRAAGRRRRKDVVRHRDGDTADDNAGDLQNPIGDAG
jgi:hypothetical protein